MPLKQVAVSKTFKTDFALESTAQVNTMMATLKVGMGFLDILLSLLMFFPDMDFHSV